MKKLCVFFTIFAMLFSSSIYATQPHQIFRSRNNFRVIEKVVEFDPSYYLGVDGYYSAGESVRQQVVQQNAAEQDKLVAILEQLVAGQDRQTKLLEFVLSGQKPPTEKPTPPASTTAWDSKALEVFNNNRCFTCHDEGKKDAEYILITPTNIASISLEQKKKIYQSCYYSEHDKTAGVIKMPKGGNMSNEDVEVLYNWLMN